VFIFEKRMLRSEGRWFQRFLELCQKESTKLSSDNPLRQVMERILDCDSYRRVRFILYLEKDDWLRYVLFHLRMKARLQTNASRDYKCYPYWHVLRYGNKSLRHHFAST